jgi:hypothetical protein
MPDDPGNLHGMGSCHGSSAKCQWFRCDPIALAACGAWACSGGLNAVAWGCCRRCPALAVECKGWITGAPWVNERACGIE